MGNYNINIQGIGTCHNNLESKCDANNMAAEFIKQLIAETSLKNLIKENNKND